MTTQARRLRMIVLAALASAAIGLPAQTAPAPKATQTPAAPPLRFEETERVLEVGYYRREFFLEFLFTTTAPGAVRIKNFTSSCPCTTVAMEKTTYYPGQKGIVAAVYDYAGEAAEPPVQIVHVVTDRAPQPILLRVVPRRTATGIWTERKTLRWIENQPRQTQTVEVEVAPELAGLDLTATPASAPELWRIAVERLAANGRYRLAVTPASDAAKPTMLALTLTGPADTTNGRPADAKAATATIALHPAGG